MYRFVGVYIHISWQDFIQGTAITFAFSQFQKQPACPMSVTQIFFSIVLHCSLALPQHYVAVMGSLCQKIIRGNQEEIYLANKELSFWKKVDV